MMDDNGLESNELPLNFLPLKQERIKRGGMNEPDL